MAGVFYHGGYTRSQLRTCSLCVHMGARTKRPAMASSTTTTGYKQDFKRALVRNMLLFDIDKVSKTSDCGIATKMMVKSWSDALITLV
jgi:hypothetical protein